MQIVELEMVPLSLRPILQRLYDMKTTQSALREGVLFSTKRNNYYYDTGTGKVIVFTAEENITISDLENANDLHRLSKVIDDAGAAEVIDGLPHRLQTQLQKGWNGGTELSQGQWQKIAIARCLFKQSDVYLFDEPFSALDAISEQHIIKRLNLKTKMSITIFITHRYSSLRLADFILVLKDGELVESGSHQELQKAGKYYSELIKAQIEPIDHLAQLDET